MENRFSTKRTIVGSLCGIATGLLGFAIATAGTKGMGYVLFGLTPFFLGVVIGWSNRAAKAAGISALISLGGTLLVLVALGKEGPLCAAMAFPFLLVSLLLGTLLGVGFRVAIKPEPKNRDITVGALFLVSPFVFLGGARLERPFLDHTRIETVTTSVQVADKPEVAWSHIQSIDSVNGSKPWLMHIGLPVPQKCTLEKTAVGARRTCYFDQGYIQETVTTWDPPRHMGLRIDRTHMPGRHWLGFENADYWLQPEGDGTRLTRTTTISSHLYPAWYWRPLEHWGVNSEHRYILDDTVRRSNLSSGR